MLFNQSDLDKEIRELHFKIDEKRRQFDAGMKDDMTFEELRKIYVELKVLTKRQELCFEESRVQNGI